MRRSKSAGGELQVGAAIVAETEGHIRASQAMRLTASAQWANSVPSALRNLRRAEVLK